MKYNFFIRRKLFSVEVSNQWLNNQLEQQTQPFSYKVVEDLAQVRDIPTESKQAIATLWLQVLARHKGAVTAVIAAQKASDAFIEERVAQGGSGGIVGPHVASEILKHLQEDLAWNSNEQGKLKIYQANISQASVDVVMDADVTTAVPEMSGPESSALVDDAAQQPSAVVEVNADSVVDPAMQSQDLNALMLSLNASLQALQRQVSEMKCMILAIYLNHQTCTPRPPNTLPVPTPPIPGPTCQGWPGLSRASTAAGTSAPTSVVRFSAPAPAYHEHPAFNTNSSTTTGADILASPQSESYDDPMRGPTGSYR